MEDRFRNLVESNNPENRRKWALEYKAQGKKVIGTFTPYVPDEVIYAAGMLPWRITGRWESASLARAYRPLNACFYHTHVLESALRGELDFLDGIVCTYWDDDSRRLWDALVHLGKFPFAPTPLHVPRRDGELSYGYFTKVISELMGSLEEFGGVEISAESLQHAIEEYNRMRAFLKRIYDTRKRERPPVSGSEVLGLTLAAMIMPVDQYNKELEVLVDWIEQRESPQKIVHPRLLVASDHLDNPAYLQLIEESGALVAMDDLDTGSRYFWGAVDPNLEPIYALAKRYITRPPCPRMFFWERQIDQIIQWVKEFNIDGVLNFPQMYAWDRVCVSPYFTRMMEEAGIPVATIEREYRLANVGQLRTRIEAFLEILDRE